MKPSVWARPHHEVTDAADLDATVDAPRVDTVLSEIGTILALHLVLALALIGALACWTSS